MGSLNKSFLHVPINIYLHTYVPNMSNVCELYSSTEYIKYILNNLVLTELVAQLSKFTERHWVAHLIKVDMEKLSWLKCSIVRKEKCFPACEKLSSLLFKCIGQKIDCIIGEATRCLIHTQGQISGAQATDWSLSLAVLPPRLLSSGWDTLWRNLPALRMPWPCIRV